LSRIFKINIVDDCATAIITAPPYLIDQTYTISNTAVAYNPEAFTISPSTCLYTYSLKMADGTSIDSAFSFTPGPPLLVGIYTTDNTKAKLYDLRLTGTVNSNSTISSSSTFKVTVLH